MTLKLLLLHTTNEHRLYHYHLLVHSFFTTRHVPNPIVENHASNPTPAPINANIQAVRVPLAPQLRGLVLSHRGRHVLESGGGSGAESERGNGHGSGGGGGAAVIGGQANVRKGLVV